MAKHKGRRRRRYIKGQIDHDFSLGALNAADAIKSNVPDNVVDTAWCSSVKCSYALSQLSIGTADGPVTVGVAHSDYTSPEILEWITNAKSWNEGDLIQQEIGRRRIRQIGVFANPDDANDVRRLADGRPITTKCGWLLMEGQKVSFWAYNKGTSALTTGGLVNVSGHANLWPK